MHTSSAPSATTTRTGGGSSSASSYRSFTARSEFFTCAPTSAAGMRTCFHVQAHKQRRHVDLWGHSADGRTQAHSSCEVWHMQAHHSGVMNDG